jgi:hypothetical protein
MVSKPKTIRIEIEFDSFKELQGVLSLISQKAKKGMHSDRFETSNCLATYEVNFTAEPEYREEELNGQLCQIFKSKMK